MEDLIDSLVEAAEDAGVEYRTDYSGRGMYGAECFAIEGREWDIVTFLKALDEDTAEDLSHPSMDNMGLDLIFYWPHLKTKEGRF